MLIATNVTDIDGVYLFSGLPDATYRVTVLAADPDFPAGLTACHDADSIPDRASPSGFFRIRLE